MLIIISPAKTLDFENRSVIQDHTIPDFLNKSKKLISGLKKLKPDELIGLMNISPKLAYMNFDRFQNWKLPYDNTNGKQSLLAFRGEVYTGINADSFTDDDFHYSKDHLRILSGLYGILRPLDLILPYRLEMGTKLQTLNAKDLYEFWGDNITKSVNKSIKESGSEFLINLASNEYYKSINKKKLSGKIITPVFKDYKNGEYKIISIYAKKARGLMTSFIIKNRISDPEELKLFDLNGYFFNESLSKDDMPVFTRG